MNLSKGKIQKYLHNIKLKKAIALTITGAFIVTGIGMTELSQPSVEAAPQHRYNQQMDNDFNPEIMLQNIHDCFGIDKQVLLDYQSKGWKVQDLHRASFIAYTAKVPIGEVLNAKTNKNWTEVSETFGITKDQYIKSRQNLMSTQLASRLGVNESTVKNLITDGYHPRDIAMAVTLSKKSGKSVNSILNHKKINNTWADVATSIGLSNEIYEQCRLDAQKCFGNKNNRRDEHPRNFQHNNGYHNQNNQK